MGGKKKRSTEQDVPSKLIGHGEQFMSMFDDCHGSKRQKVPSRPSVSSSPDHQESPESSVDLESNPGDIEEIFSDGKEESSEGELSDSLECLNVLDSKRILGKKNIGKQHIPQVSQASRKEKKNFMSGKISKVHKVAPLATAPVDLPEDEDEEEEQRRLFKQASREVQHLGSKGMTKRATKNWKQQEWERLGGKRAKLHRMPKSDGMLMFRGRIAKEEAARNAEAKKGAVLRESLQVLKQQKVKRRKILAKRNGGVLRKTLLRGP